MSPLPDDLTEAQARAIGRDGHFEFVGLPTGKYEIFTSVRASDNIR
jgi:hypothetical protein